ncbi:MAG: hypothetical protein ABI425_05355 [Patescibacteria group bacterium]
MAFKKEKPDEQIKMRVPSELIDSGEFYRRRQVWRAYYARVRNSACCKRFLKMKTALKSGDMSTFRQLHAQNRQALIYGDSLPTPPFPDPDIEMTYGRLGRKEQWEKQTPSATRD